MAWWVTYPPWSLPWLGSLQAPSLAQGTAACYGHVPPQTNLRSQVLFTFRGDWVHSGWYGCPEWAPYFCVRVSIILRQWGITDLEVLWDVFWSSTYSKQNAQFQCYWFNLISNCRTPLDMLVVWINILPRSEMTNKKCLCWSSATHLLLSHHKGTAVADITNQSLALFPLKPGIGLRFLLCTTLSIVTTNQWNWQLRSSYLAWHNFSCIADIIVLCTFYLLSISSLSNPF